MKGKDIKWVSIVQIKDKGKDVYFLEMTKEGNSPWQILGFGSEQKGLDYYEESYNRAHTRSYEKSMSACVHYIFFHPSIVRIVNTKENLHKLVGKNPQLSEYNNVSGFHTGIGLDPSIAKTLWERGKKPSLIDPNRYNRIMEKKEADERMQHAESR